MKANWIIFSLLPPALWAINNHTEKFLLTKYLKGKGGASLIILAELFSIIILPLVAIFNHKLIPMSALHIFLMLTAGLVSLTGYLFYIYALAKEDASVVIPIYQTIPVFSFFLAYFFLGENLSALQIFACLLVVLGAITISLEFEGKFKLRGKVLVYMLLASFFSALAGLLFKYVALRESYWGANFWSYAGSFIGGILLIVFHRNWRRELFGIIKNNPLAVVGLSALDEAINLGACLIFNFAALNAPLALVSVLSNGFQPIFVLLFGIIITIFLPRIGEEKIGKAHLIQRIAAIAIIFLGTFLLNR